MQNKAASMGSVLHCARAWAWAFAWVIAAPALAAPAAVPPPLLLPPLAYKTLSVQDIAPCGDAADPAACLLAAIGRALPDERARIAALSIRGAPAGSGASETGWSLAHTAVLAADRRGVDPASALASLAALSPEDRLQVLGDLCRDAQAWSPPGLGPRYAAWQDERRASHGLIQAAADRLEGALGPDDAHTTPGDGHATLGMVAACRAGLGDFVGVDRALSRAPTTDPRLRLTMLIVERRFNEALALAESARPADVAAPANGAMAGSQFIRLQQDREQLLLAAQEAGQADVAKRAAAILLEATLAPDRLENPSMDSGLPAALAWLTTQPDVVQTRQWVERADQAVRPGRPGWNYGDAVAVHRAWLALGQPNRAQTLYDAVAAEAAKAPTFDRMAQVRMFRARLQAPTGGYDAAAEAADRIVAEALAMTPASADNGQGARFVAAEMLGATGHWDEATALGDNVAAVFEVDLRAGVGASMLKDRLAHARQPGEQAELLGACAGRRENLGYDPAGAVHVAPLPLETAAQCVRDLSALKPPPADAASAPSDPRQMNFMWAYLSGQIPQAALTVADRATQADQPALAREMLMVALKAWHGGPVEMQYIDPSSVDLMIDIAGADLHARGKL